MNLANDSLESADETMQCCRRLFFPFFRTCLEQKLDIPSCNCSSDPDARRSIRPVSLWHHLLRSFIHSTNRLVFLGTNSFRALSRARAEAGSANLRRFFGGSKSSSSSSFIAAIELLRADNSPEHMQSRGRGGI